MYIMDFEFADKRLSEFGCIIGVLKGSTDTNEIDVGCNITFNKIKNNHTSKYDIASSSYEEVYTTTIEIFKNFCESGQDCFTTLEAEKMIKWLNRRTYHKFKMYGSIFSDVDICYFGTFTSVKQIMLGNRIIGLSAVFEANTPYALGEEVTVDFDLSADEKFELFPEGDEYGIVYPAVKIKCLSDGDLKLYNETTDNYIYVSGCTKDETLTVLGEYEIILSDKREQKDISNCFNYEYFEMLIDDEKVSNHYYSTIPCELSISYRPIRKVAVI